MTTKHFCILVASIAISSGRAAAEPFWITYEADDGLFPEQVGWERMAYGGGADRWFEDGALILDGRASIEIADLYVIERPLHPGPGELFVTQWRLRVDEVQGFNDPVVSVGSYGDGVVTLGYSESSIYSYHEGVWIDFAPGVFHDYRLTSSNMLSYHLYIDEDLAYTGVFVGPWYKSIVKWGDGVLGSRSLSAWDYVRFGIVVPEPTSAVLLGCAALVLIRTVGQQRWRSLR